MKKIILLSLSIFIAGFIFGQKDFTARKNVSYTPNIVKGKALERSKGNLLESFEGAFPPNGWTKANPDGGSGWAQIEDGTAPLPGWQGGTMTIAAGGGSKAAYCTWNTGGSTSNDQWLITPAVDIASGNTIKFQLLNTTGYADNLDILLSTTNANTASFTETIAEISLTAAADWTEYEYDLSAYVGQTVYIAFREHVANNQAEGSFIGLDLVQIGEITEPDAELSALNIPNTVSLNEEINVNGTIISNGTNITSFDVSYNIDGGTESDVYSVTGVNLGLGDSYDFSHNVAYTMSEVGTHTIQVTISNVNGGGETNLGNNTKSKDITVIENFVQRTVLVEQFTTENCGNCPPVLNYLEGLVDGNDNVIMMAHHTGYYTDFLTIPESEEHLEFFNAGGGTYAPAGMVDRHYNGLDNDNYQGPDPGPVFWDGNPFGGTRINDRLSVPASATVNINGKANTTGALELTVSGEFLNNLTHNVGVSLWITEDHINAQNQSGAANWVHRYTVRDAISARLGDPITTSTNEGDTYRVDYTFTPNSSWNSDELYLVAMVNNMNATDVNDRALLNAVQVKLSDLQPLGIENMVKTSSVSVYPNPAHDYVNITNVANANIEIYNMLGELVHTQVSTQDNVNINISNLKTGNYIIKINAGDIITTKKLNIVK